MTLHDELKKIYEQIPKIECKKLCFRACGPIFVEPAENQLIVEKVGHNPIKSPLEMLYNAKVLGNKDCLTCSALKDNLCSIYEYRPLNCRLYGVVKEMKCPFGCLPARWLKDKEAKRLLKQLRKLGDPNEN